MTTNTELIIQRMAKESGILEQIEYEVWSADVQNADLKALEKFAAHVAHICANTGRLAQLEGRLVDVAIRAEFPSP